MLEPGRDAHAMTPAVVLIEAERDAMSTLGGALADLDGVAEAYSVTGEWDFVAIVRVPRHEMLAEVVTGELVKLPGVSRTQTMVAFEVFSRHDLEAMFSIGPSGGRRGVPRAAPRGQAPRTGARRRRRSCAAGEPTSAHRRPSRTPAMHAPRCAARPRRPSRRARTRREQVHQQAVVPGAVGAELVVAQAPDGLEADGRVGADRALVVAAGSMVKRWWPRSR